MSECVWVGVVALRVRDGIKSLCKGTSEASTLEMI